MRRFFSIILAFGGLFFLTALAAPGEFSGGKFTAIAIGALLLFLSWMLWRRPPRPLATAAVLPEAPLATSGGHPPPRDAAGERRALIKAKLAYEDLKHLQGVPGLRPKQRVTMLLTVEGIRLVDPKSWDGTYYTIGWSAFRGVGTTDAQSVRDDSRFNAARTGAAARGTRLGGAIALEATVLLLEKSPLIVNFELAPNDPIISSAVFSTWLNEEIAGRILSYRTQLVASGELTFPVRADQPGPPASGATL